MKTCKKCKCLLPLSEFYKHSEMHDGYLNFCKVCVKKRVSKYNKKPHVIMRDRLRRRNDPRHAENMKRYAENHRKQINIYNKQWEQKNKYKRQAQSIVATAVKKDRIIKPQCCEKCGIETKLEGHHEDYSKPLSVIWLCSKCHGAVRRKPDVA